jgi:galactitol-specific phosphotransferase system IIB component
MAANTCASSTGTVSGTDPNFVLTKRVANRKDGVFLYLKYTIGTSTTLTIAVKTICASLSATDTYRTVQTAGTTMTAQTYVIYASGISTSENFKIPIALSQHDDTLIITITPNTGGVDAVLVANIMEA